jgi:hypothetical protein
MACRGGAQSAFGDPHPAQSSTKLGRELDSARRTAQTPAILSGLYFAAFPLAFATSPLPIERAPAAMAICSK